MYLHSSLELHLRKENNVVKNNRIQHCNSVKKSYNNTNANSTLVFSYLYFFVNFPSEPLLCVLFAEEEQSAFLLPVTVT